MARTAKRKTFWSDLLIGETTVAGLGEVNEVLLAESNIENHSGVTVTRIVGDISLKYFGGTTNVVDLVFWLAPAYAGVALIAGWNSDDFERMRVMWVGRRMIDLADDTHHISVDVKTQCKTGQGTQLLFTLDNKSANTLTYSAHLRTLSLIS